MAEQQTGRLRMLMFLNAALVLLIPTILFLNLHEKANYARTISSQEAVIAYQQAIIDRGTDIFYLNGSGEKHVLSVGKIYSSSDIIQLHVVTENQDSSSDFCYTDIKDGQFEYLITLIGSCYGYEILAELNFFNHFIRSDEKVVRTSFDALAHNRLTGDYTSVVVPRGENLEVEYSVEILVGDGVSLFHKTSVGFVNDNVVKRYFVPDIRHRWSIDQHPNNPV